MPIGIGGAGICGVALEAVPGTYVAPAKFMPIRSESLSLSQETNWRREIRGVVDVHGAGKGNGNIAGDISVTVEHDSIVYWLYGARATVVKSGTTPNFIYTFTPSNAAQAPNKTLSISIERNGQVFGYTGCVISSMEWTVDNGLLICNMSIIGQTEANQAALTPTFTNTEPFGAGSYDLQIPTATQVFDVEEFTFSVNDNGEPQFRLRNDRFTPSFVRFGERETTLSMARDFIDRTEYDAFKALTAQSVTLRTELASNANRYVEIVVPSIIKDSYEIGLGGQGDVVRAEIEYQAIYNAAPVYTIEIGTSTNIT